MKTGRVLLAVVVGMSFVPSAWSATLSVGDPAPPLVVTEWITGEPVQVPPTDGKQITVVEFWATWCGPCKASIPELTSLQERYASDGVRIVGVSSHDSMNTLGDVKRFVKSQGKRIGYSIAYDQDGSMNRAYMDAAGQNTIPTAFVIDRQGKIAWIGFPPRGLARAIRNVVDDQYDSTEDREVAKARRRASKATSATKQLKYATQWSALAPDDPEPCLIQMRAHMAATRDLEKSMAAAREAVACAQAKDAEAMVAVARALFEVDSSAPRYKELGLMTINDALKMDPGNAEVLVTRIELLAEAGELADAHSYAVQAAETLAGQGAELARIARALAAPKRDAQYSHYALGLVDQALAADAGNLGYMQLKFFIMTCCLKQSSGVEAFGASIISAAGGDPAVLNEFAWSILERACPCPEANKVALAAARRCDELSGSSNWAYLDTLALALYRTGDNQAALDTQRNAIDACTEPKARPQLRRRLREFRRPWSPDTE